MAAEGSSGATRARAHLWLHDGLIVAALITACLLVFAQVLGLGFLHYDDDLYVVLNPMVKKGLSLESVSWAFTTFDQNHWHPLTWLSHMLDVEIFGLAPAGHHATSLLLHVANTLLVFAFFRITAGDRWPSVAVAALFAIHPTHVESVAWVADRKDLLMAFFGLLSLLAYTRYARGLRWRWLVASLVAMFLGVMAKASVIVWPALFLVVDLWPLRRVEGVLVGRADHPSQIAVVTWRRMLFEKAWILAPAVALATVAVFANLKGELSGLVRLLPTMHSIATAADAVLFYVQTTLWPVDLALPYPKVGSIPSWHAALGALVVVGVSAAGLRWRRRAPWILAGWLWYLVTLLPASGIVLIGTELRADRYTYVTTIGLYVIVAWGAADLMQRGRLWRRLVVVVGSTVLVLLALGSARYVRLFRGDLELLQHAADVTEDNTTAYNNLAVELHHLGRFDEALLYYDKVLNLDYMDYDARFNRARLHKERGQLQEALAALDWLTRRHMERADFAAQRAEILAAMGRREEAETEYRRAIDLDPGLVPARNNLALLLVDQGDLAGAALQLEQILSRRPDDVAVQANLANVYLLGEAWGKAEAAYRRVLAQQPAHVEASYRLGALRAYQGNLDEAIALYQKALAHAPDRTDILTDLGSALAQQARVHEARAALERALRVDPAFAPAQQALQRLAPTGALDSNPPPAP